LPLKKTQYRISEIFLFAPDPETRTQAEEAARSILEQLKAGADFRVAAPSACPRRRPRQPAATWAGSPPRTCLPELVPAIESAAGPGLLDPITVDNGVYILYIQNKREPAEATTKVDLIRLITQRLNGREPESRHGTHHNRVTTSRPSPIRRRASGLSRWRTSTSKSWVLKASRIVESAEIGKPTDIFAVSGGLGTMYVCRREEGAEALPSREDLKSSLKGRELNMISERELRNLRRDATIIYR
jgi:peptidyl-prolyl cis-trans isomerase SurA